MSDQSPSDFLAYAQASQAEADAELSGIRAQLEKIILARDKKKDLFDEASDYRNGVITFEAEMTEDTISSLASSIRRLVRMRPGKPITVYLTTPGGNIFEGFGLLDSMEEAKALGCPVTIKVRGNACSMGAVVLQGAAHRVVGLNSYLMLHRASFGVQGNAAEVEDELETTKMLEARIYAILARSTGKPAAWWKKRLGNRKDAWFGAEEALELGLVDEIG